MDQLQQVLAHSRRHIFLAFLLENVIVLTAFWALTTYLDFNPLINLGIGAVFALLMTFAVSRIVGSFLIEPLQAIWQAVLHISPKEDAQAVAAPDLAQLRLGRELVTNLMGQVYQLANITEQTQIADQAEKSALNRNFIATTLPLPLFVLDATETIRFANEAASRYVGISVPDLIGKNIYMVLDMSFPSEETFDKWLKDAKQHSATAVTTWERVRLNVRDSHPTLLFDLAAYYNRDNTDGIETMLVLFDHTKQYSQDDQAISFMALSVHELRTPLTLLRGYIEVFEEELAGKVSPELADFMQKMRATSQQLTAFVNNILNVARIDDDQLELKLQEEDWATVLQQAIDGMELRAGVRGIKLECSVAPNLPPVGVDRLSIQEVVNNLTDNAIKYSGDSKRIKVTSQLGKDGLIETTIQDFGVGIPTAVMPNLFTKFYRDHRNRAQIGGTGLGLYLSKAIIGAHGGNLWVQSKEGQGSTFGFSLVPYAQLAKEQKRSSDKDQEIVRGAHGWIKNHSLYRR